MPLLQEAANEGHRVLVFSQFTRYLRKIAARLDHEKIGYSYLDGTTAHRHDVIDGFTQGDAGRQAGPACANDCRLHRANRRTRPRPPPTQVFQANQSLRKGVSEMRWCSTCQLSRSISSSSAW